MIWIGFGFILGAILGSFIKALADRSLKDATFLGRSYCQKCKKKLRWYDLFPLLSYLLLKGRCRYCHKKIGITYLLVEVVMASLVAFLFWQAHPSFPGFKNILSLIFFLLDLVFKIFILSTIVALAITDLKETIIPDRITYPAIAIAFLYIEITTLFKLGLQYYALASTPFGRLFLPPQTPYKYYLFPHFFLTLQPFLGSLLSAIFITSFFLALILITRGRGMGGGDLKLGIFLGLAFSFPQAILAIMLAFVAGSIAALLMIIIKRRKFGQTIPFGPFLTLGAIATLFWAPQIMKWLNWS